MTSSPGSRADRLVGRYRGFAAAVIVLAALLAWTAWDNAMLRAQRSELQQQNEALRQAQRRGATVAAPSAPASGPSVASAPAAVTASVARADPLAPLARPGVAASGPSLERALETLREPTPNPRASPFGSGTGS